MSPPVESPLDWVTIKTTLPKGYPAMANRQPILTERLILRPYAASDLDAFHALRMQPEVMKWTSAGRVDADLDHTRQVLDKRLPGSADGEGCYEFAVCWAATGEMIGTAGSHARKGDFGWPVLGYMIRSEFWGKGLATEIVAGFLRSYWALPREETEIEVERSTLGPEGGGGHVRTECIVAVTADGNGASQRVLSKTGFRLARLWEEDLPERPGSFETLYGYVLEKPGEE